MAEVNAKDLTAKTSPASTDSMLLFGTTSNEGAKITVDNLADNILSRLATKSFANQVGGSSAATILAQLATLNSNIQTTSGNATAQSVENIDTIVTKYWNFGKVVFLPLTIRAASGQTISGGSVLASGYPRPLEDVYFLSYENTVTRLFRVKVNGELVNVSQITNAWNYGFAVYITND